MSSNTLFIEPLDILILRGNKLFGDPGSYGESHVPPWPSVIAGAIRSRMLADAGVDLAAFARGELRHPELGTPTEPGRFVLRGFHLAQRDAHGKIELLIAPPADLSIVEDDDQPQARGAQPTVLHPALQSSSPLPLQPVLAETSRSKPASGYWLTQTGWQRYLNGEPPKSDELVKSSSLWRSEERVGVGLEHATRSAAEGKLYTTQAIAFKDGVGFMAEIAGATPPQDGLIRLGGDGRGAALHSIPFARPAPDYNEMIKERRCRLVLTTPGLFTQGWLPNGVYRDGNDYRFDLHGVRGRLVCAAVPRAEVISGWDLAKWQPKPAERVAPTGSVYWLDELEASQDALEKLANEGLWSDPCEDAARRAEGFNRLALARWPQER